MTSTVPTRRPSTASRRVGYVIAVVIHAVLLYLINGRPGWQAVPFLTGDTRQVLGLVNLSLAVGLVANLLFLFYDAPWWKSLGDLVTTAIGLAAMVRIWQVFPFDFAGYSFNWALFVRVVLIIGIVGSSIGIVVQFVSLVRAAARGGR